MRRGIVLAVVAVVILALLLTLLRPIPSVEGAYVKASLRNSAGYFTLRNYGLVGFCVVGVEVVEPSGVMAMMHKTVEESGMHKMVRVDRICVGPLGSFELREGGHHIMIMNPLKGVDVVKLRLKLDNGGYVEFSAEVRKLGELT